MMIQLKDVLEKYKIKAHGVIQVGSHWAEEHEEFVKCGIKEFVYIEPCKEAFSFLVKKLLHNTNEIVYSNYAYDSQEEKIRIMNYACGNEEKEMPMYVSHQNQGQSNSLLKPLLHTQQHPDIIFDDAEIVKMVTLDSLNATGDLLVMDCQGYEGEVLKGAEETLKSVNIIYTEVNRGQTYDGNMEIEEMDAFLSERGFIRVETYWPSPNWTWGDAVYIHKRYINEIN